MQTVHVLLTLSVKELDEAGERELIGQDLSTTANHCLIFGKRCSYI